MQCPSAADELASSAIPLSDRLDQIVVAQVSTGNAELGTVCGLGRSVACSLPGLQKLVLWKPNLIYPHTAMPTPTLPSAKLVQLGRDYAQVCGYPRTHGKKIALEHLVTTGSEKKAKKALGKELNKDEQQKKTIRLEQHLSTMPKPSLRGYEPKKKWV